MHKPFEPGNTSGKLGGRPRGARNKLSRKFLGDCHADWQEHGAKAISIMRREDPAGYCKMMASLVPRELEVTATAVAELADDELDRIIETLRAQIAQQQQVPMLTSEVVDAEVINNDR
jgi:hypothetical protein